MRKILHANTRVSKERYFRSESLDSTIRREFFLRFLKFIYLNFLMCEFIYRVYFFRWINEFSN